MKIVEAAKKRSPKTLDFVQSQGAVSFYEVWIYPYAKMQTGARVLFFEANQQKEVVCYIYLEQDFEIDPSSKTRSDLQYNRFITRLCRIAVRALVKQQVHIVKDYDVYISAGPLTYADFS